MQSKFVAGKAAGEGETSALWLKIGHAPAFNQIWGRVKTIPVGYLLQGVVEIEGEDYFAAGQRAAYYDFLLRYSLSNGHVRSLRNNLTKA